MDLYIVTDIGEPDFGCDGFPEGDAVDYSEGRLVKSNADHFHREGSMTEDSLIKQAEWLEGYLEALEELD